MANVSDKSILTAAGKALLAQLNAEEKALVIDKMIFANVPNRPEYPQPDDVVPADNVVHQSAVEQRGRLSEDSVIYSTTLASNEGPFEFNWTGAYCSEYGVLVTIDHHSMTPKTVDEPGVSGNTLVRSVVLEYKDIAEITNITVDASTWQYNATPRMKKMDDDVAQSIIDQNGKDWFIEDGFLVTPQASAFNIKAGAGYVSGNRVTLEFDRNVQVPNKPSFIYVDAHREGTPTGEQVTLFDFVVTAEDKDDYTDANGVKHFVCKIAQVLADGSVSDLRPDGLEDRTIKGHDEVQKQIVNGKIFPENINYSAMLGEQVPDGTTHLRINGNLYSCHPRHSGVISSFGSVGTMKTAVIGGQTVQLPTLEQSELRKLGDPRGWGCTGDYIIDDASIGGIVNPSPTDDTDPFELYLSSQLFVRDGGGLTYYLNIDRVHMGNRQIWRNLNIKFFDSISTPFNLWVGDMDENPDNYNGRKIQVQNVRVYPSINSPCSVRFRGLLKCAFEKFTIETYKANELTASAKKLFMMDGVVNCQFRLCDFAPKAAESGEWDLSIFDIGLMKNVDGTANLSNGLGTTSTSFSNCYFRRTNKIGRLLGDGITFCNETIFEHYYFGIEAIYTGSILDFVNCYYENGIHWFIYANGPDSKNPGPHVRITGGKVQRENNNGSQPDKAFLKARHAYALTVKGTVFQGAPQTRLVELVTGDNGLKDCLIYQDLNCASKPRKIGATKTAPATTINGSNKIRVTINLSNQDIRDGDVIDIVHSNLGANVSGVTVKLPNRPITQINESTFEFEGIGTASAVTSFEINFDVYKPQENCLANMDASTDWVQIQSHQRTIGSNTYHFNDGVTEFIKFEKELSSADDEVTLLNDGLENYVSNDMAFIKSAKLINYSGTESLKYAYVDYGGERFAKHRVINVDNSTKLASTTQYVKPIKIDPGEPISVRAWSGAGGEYPRKITVVMEVVHTGLTYYKDH